MVDVNSTTTTNTTDAGLSNGSFLMMRRHSLYQPATITAFTTSTKTAPFLTTPRTRCRLLLLFLLLLPLCQNLPHFLHLLLHYPMNLQPLISVTMILVQLDFYNIWMIMSSKLGIVQKPSLLEQNVFYDTMNYQKNGKKMNMCCQGEFL